MMAAEEVTMKRVRGVVSSLRIRVVDLLTFQEWRRMKSLNDDWLLSALDEIWEPPTPQPDDRTGGVGARGGIRQALCAETLVSMATQEREDHERQSRCPSRDDWDCVPDRGSRWHLAARAAMPLGTRNYRQFHAK